MEGVVDEDEGDDKLIARGIAESTLHPDNPYHPNNYKVGDPSRAPRQPLPPQQL